MLDIPVGPASIFAAILIGYFVMTVWYAQALKQKSAKPDEKPVRQLKAG